MHTARVGAEDNYFVYGGSTARGCALRTRPRAGVALQPRHEGAAMCCHADPRVRTSSIRACTL
eukprot:3039211-Prymnesium_polylepis.1